MKNIVIIGSGKAGNLLLEDIRSHHKEITVIGTVDDNKNKKNLGPIKNLKKILNTFNIEELVIAIPSASGSLIRTILLQCKDAAPLSIRILPRNFEIVMKSKVCLHDTRPLVPEDIVGEHIEKENQLKAYKEIKGKSILITGAGGSIGSELSKQVVLAAPKKLVLIDFSEYNLFHLKLQLEIYRKISPNTEINYILGDINNTSLMKELFEKYQFHTVFHTAAYKHVPALEENIYEAAHNNISGTYTIASLSDEYNVQKCILISTDKAVMPKSIMGKTKKIAELIMNYFDSKNKTNQFVAVRFGNVFNSSGSAVEVFLKQINENTAITITDSEMSRFFMTIHEAIHLVLQTWLMSKKRKLYMLEMNNPVSILEIAVCLVIMQGHRLDSTQFTTIGKRKGEKIYEQLLDPHTEHKNATSNSRIYSVSRKKSDSSILPQLQSVITFIESDEAKNHSSLGEKKLMRLITGLLELGA